MVAEPRLGADVPKTNEEIADGSGSSASAASENPGAQTLADGFGSGLQRPDRVAPSLQVASRGEIVAFDKAEEKRMAKDVPLSAGFKILKDWKLGFRALATGNHEEAARLFEGILAKDPAHWEARAMLASNQSDLNQQDQAFQNAVKAFERLRVPVLYAIIAEYQCYKNNAESCRTWLQAAFDNGFVVDEYQFRERFGQLADMVKERLAGLLIGDVGSSWVGEVDDKDEKRETVTLTLDRTSTPNDMRHATLKLESRGCVMTFVGGGRIYNTGVFYAEKTSRLRCAVFSGLFVTPLSDGSLNVQLFGKGLADVRLVGELRRTNSGG